MLGYEISGSFLVLDRKRPQSLFWLRKGAKDIKDIDNSSEKTRKFNPGMGYIYSIFQQPRSKKYTLQGCIFFSVCYTETFPRKNSENLYLQNS